MSETLTDLFCGAGGSGQGAHGVPGVELVMAANHWQQAIDTHQANFPAVAHDCADLSQVDPRRYPRTTLLWASPECTNHSGARGKKRAVAQLGLFGNEAERDPGAERSRATMWDVPRFAEHHRYRAVIVENVVDVARWVMWPAWLHAMELLGYRHQVVFLNSMHAPAIAAPRAPQSRDRLYVVFWRHGQPTPQLDIRPAAWCPSCGRQVAAVQSWKRPDRQAWGRYRAQYVYRCPSSACRFSIVEPYADPASTAIDWALPGLRIGDRDQPLSPKTMARIRAGLGRYANPSRPFVTVHRGRPTEIRTTPIERPLQTLTAGGNHYGLLVPSGGTWNEDARPVDEPMRARTTRENEALVVPVEGRDGKGAQLASAPLRTQTTRLESALVVPYSTGVAHPADGPLHTLPATDRFGVAFITELRGGSSDARPVTDPLATVTASGNHHMLVRNNTARGDAGQMCTPADEPARTLTTAGHQSLVGWPHDVPDVEDCTFRMLEPREIQAAMAFHPTYRVLGSKRDQVRQLGNAVTPPAAEWLLRAVVASLNGGA